MQAAVDVEKPANPIETTEGCRYCWMCRHVCPVGHVTHSETLTPHGWALTIASVRRGTLRWNEETAGVLYSCADCGLCRAHCITDRPLPDAIAAARAEVVAAGHAPAVVYEINEKLQRWSNAYEHRSVRTSTDVAGHGGAASAQPGASAGGSASVPAGMDASGAAPGFASASAAASGRASATNPIVGLFIGDAARRLGAREIEGVRKLLAAIGITPILIGDGRSSGQLASSLGLTETATKLAREVVNEVEAAGCRELLVLTPGDHYTFAQLYRDRLKIEWPATVEIKDVSTLLARAVAEGRLKFRTPVQPAAAYAYHDPCHTPRIDDREHSAPRTLLSAALGESGARNLFWREGRAHPCGAIGGLDFTQPAIAAKLADARLADTRAAGASLLITDDPACAAHLRARPQQDVTVLGLYELLADRIA
jgi:Fe-S oxidoreductase